MKTTYKTIGQLIKNNKQCPFPISVIPNNMGINLCSVEGIEWKEQKDGQLTSLTIHFIPNNKSKNGK